MADQSEAADLALEEARRSLSYQAGAVDELRSRTGLLLAASSVTGSFLGSAASKQEEFGLLGVAAVLAFALAVGACLYILQPRGWTFATSPTVLLEDWVDHERDPVAMKRFLAEKLEGHYDENRVALDQLLDFFRVAGFAVVAEVILGCVQIATST